MLMIDDFHIALILSYEAKAKAHTTRLILEKIVEV